MIYILFVLIGGLLYISWISNKEILSASFLYFAISFFWTGLAISSMSLYGIEDIHFNTFAIILFSLTFFFIGEQFGQRIIISKTKSNRLDEYKALNTEYINIHPIVTVTIILICFLNLYLSYKNFISFLNNNGFGSDFDTAFALARNALVMGRVEYSKGTLISQIGILSSCLSYFLFYVFCRNLLYHKKFDFLKLIPLIPIVLESLLSTSRNGFIKYFCVLGFILFITFKSYTGWSKKSNTKILKYAAILFLVIIVVFRLAGNLTGKTQKIGFLDNIYMYFSNSLFAFDSFLNSNYVHSDFFGKVTLRALYVVLNLFGADFPIAEQFFPSYSFGISGSDNILTGLCAPILDYGVLGTFFTRFLLGAIYGKVCLSLRTHVASKNWINMVYFGLFMYPLLMMPIADSLGSLCNLGLVYSLFYMIIIHKIFLRKEALSNNIIVSRG